MNRTLTAIVLLAWLLVFGGRAELRGEAMDAGVGAVERTHLQATPLPLEAVRLTGGPLKHAQELDAQILLGLDPDRMMAGYRIRAGLEPKARGYGGWDSVAGKQLTGHIAGHYLSGVSLMYAATGDERFKVLADYVVDEMKAVQDKRGNGYLGAIANNEGKDGALIFEQQVARGDIRSSGFDLNGMWSPWYTLHKTFAGLRDAYRYTGNQTALKLEIGFASWAEDVLADLSDEQIQRMLNTEFGGMNEVLLDLYADTGDERWLSLSQKFEHKAIIDPLAHQQDILPGKHGNTQVPKLIGSADRYAYTGNEQALAAATFFWERVVDHHSFATGGDGKDEYFHEPDHLGAIIAGRTCETCNVYNMLKLTRRLFAFHPDAAYADFEERALFNHILASQDPTDGWACYMVPVGQGVRHEYETHMLDGNFTCCTGTSLESHALHGYGIYYEAGDTLYVNLFAPSVARWSAKSASVTVDTDFPEGESADVSISVDKPTRFTLALRKPYWCDGFGLKVNGEAVPVAMTDASPSSSYVLLDRTWENGDKVDIALPKTLRLEPTRDEPSRTAILWGPLVLAGDLGDGAPAEDQRIPVLVTGGRPVADWLKPIEDRPGWFKTRDVGRPRDVEFTPFYLLHRKTYGIYWDLYTPEAWQAEEAKHLAEQQRLRRLEADTVAYVQPGEMQPERDYHFQAGEGTRPIRTDGRAGRVGDTWFSFDVPVESDSAMTLCVTYCSSEHRRGEAKFDIEIDGQIIATEQVERAGPRAFYDKQYEVPRERIEDQSKVTVTFRAHQDSVIAGIYGIRMIRSHGEE